MPSSGRFCADNDASDCLNMRQALGNCCGCLMRRDSRNESYRFGLALTLRGDGSAGVAGFGLDFGFDGFFAAEATGFSRLVVVCFCFVTIVDYCFLSNTIDMRELVRTHVAQTIYPLLDWRVSAKHPGQLITPHWVGKKQVRRRCVLRLRRAAIAANLFQRAH